MANEVKQLIRSLIDNSTKVEITVDDVFEAYGDLDVERNRVDVLSALRELEHEKIGVLAVGRRGHPTRFIKGAIRAKSNVDAKKQEDITNIVKTMDADKALVIQKNGNLTIDDNVVFHNENRNEIIEILKTLTENGFGTFVIGRRGGQSRFIKKSKEAEAIDKKVVEDKEIDNSIKFNVINNVLFKTTNEGFSSIKEALENKSILIDDLFKIEEQINKFGYFKLN